MPDRPFLSRQARFAEVGSTSDIVREWLAAGEPEVCLAVADEQSAGRGRLGRPWRAPAGKALLLSLGFRPSWLAPDRAWQLAVVVSLAMADAAEEAAGLADQAVRLKWPNDMVVEEEVVEEAGIPASGVPAPGAATSSRDDGPGYRKLAGVLGESAGLGTDDPTVIVGIGVNADWPRDEFPADLAATMTSLRLAAHGRPVDMAALLDAFLARLEVRVEALRGGRFDVADWQGRQLVTGRLVRVEHTGGPAEVVRAVGVDVRTGGLVVADLRDPAAERLVLSGEVQQVRLATGVGV